MRGDHQGLPRLEGRQRLVDGSNHAIGHLDPRLSPAGPDLGSRGPARQLLGELLLEFPARESLPRTGVRLPEPLVGVDLPCHETGEGLGGLPCSHQIGADDPGGLQALQKLGRLGCLLASHVIQGDVGLALEALLGVPRRAPVPPQDDASGLHDEMSSAP
jgi:hypothetical protein